MFPTDCNKVQNRLMIIHSSILIYESWCKCKIDHCVIVMIIHLRVASLLSLDDLEDEGVLGEDPEHVNDAGHHPGLHRGQTLRLGGVGCD